MLKQSQMKTALGINATRWNNYEKGVSPPTLEIFIKISNYFGVSEADILHKDLRNAHLIPKIRNSENAQNAHLNAHPTAHLIQENEVKRLTEELHLKDNIIADKQQIINLQLELIMKNKVLIQELQNERDQTSFSVNEEGKKQYRPRKDRKSA